MKKCIFILIIFSAVIGTGARTDTAHKICGKVLIKYKGLFGPREPWGMSWRKKKIFKIPKFKEICFKVPEELKYIIIDTR